MDYISEAAHPIFSVEDIDAVRLRLELAPALQDLLEQCDDYYQMVEGRLAETNAAIEEISVGPPGFAQQDIFCFGLRRNNDKVIGVINLLRHYRRPNQWYLSFFMLHPTWRGQRLGQRCFNALQNWLIGQNADSILLAVVEQNTSAAKFWKAAGFQEFCSYPSTTIGLREHVLIEFEKSLN